jgi:phosphoribosylaminoimidazole-succinocarboxamide synthase
LILADTKYEFGLSPSGALLLIDEVHTPDSSRFWEASTYESRQSVGQEPESLDKELVRQALQQAGYTGDSDLPDLGPDVWAQTSTRYRRAFERITGTEFAPGATPVADRIVSNLRTSGVL